MRISGIWCLTSSSPAGQMIEKCNGLDRQLWLPEVSGIIFIFYTLENNGNILPSPSLHSSVYPVWPGAGGRTCVTVTVTWETSHLITVITNCPRIGREGLMMLINWVVKSWTKWPSVSRLLYCGLSLIKSEPLRPKWNIKLQSESPQGLISTTQSTLLRWLWCGWERPSDSFKSWPSNTTHIILI